MPVSLDDSLKVVQMVFYVIAMTLAVLTYRSAKKGLLNTVNTEYHKRVIDRIKELTDELLSEFQRSSPSFWANDHSIEQAVAIINRRYLETKDWPDRPELFGIPNIEIEERLHDFIREVEYDPFLPEDIRDAVTGILRKRREVTLGSTLRHLSDYQEGLKAGKYTDTLGTNAHRIRNLITNDQIEAGVEIAQVEAEINQILVAVQQYFRRFDPITPRWRRRLKVKSSSIALVKSRKANATSRSL